MYIINIVGSIVLVSYRLVSCTSLAFSQSRQHSSLRANGSHRQDVGRGSRHRRGPASSVMSSDIESTSFVDSDDENSTRYFALPFAKHLYFCETVLSSLLWYNIIIPAKAREYVFTGVGLCICVCVCLSVCDHDN